MTKLQCYFFWIFYFRENYHFIYIWIPNIINNNSNSNNNNNNNNDDDDDDDDDDNNSNNNNIIFQGIAMLLEKPLTKIFPL